MRAIACTVIVLCAVELLTTQLLAAEPQRATLLLGSGGVVTVTLPDSVLTHAAVKKQLESALTTTFLIVGRVRGTPQTVASRLEIRYDLWDEVYHVRRIAADRKVETQRVPQEQFAKWWRTPLRVATIGGRAAIVDVEVTVLPFSAAEEDDARQWLSKSGGVGGAGTKSSGVVDALIGTTISARPLVAFHWSAEVAPR
ncbi:MAG TPA: hypothetical protein VGF48_10005 [Thermoanaerobaculia bacterium]